MLFQTMIDRIRRSKWRCPKCSGTQSIPAAKKEEAVRCKFCGALVPPQKEKHPIKP